LHTLVGGLEFTREEQANFGYTGLGTMNADPIYAPNPYSSMVGLNPVRNGVRSNAQVDTQSAYLFDTIKLGEQWIFNVGARADHFNVKYDGVALSSAAANPGLPAGTLVPVVLRVSDTVGNVQAAARHQPGAVRFGWQRLQSQVRAAGIDHHRAWYQVGFSEAETEPDGGAVPHHRQERT
jgi:catecholate siderophore receptor